MSPDWKKLMFDVDEIMMLKTTAMMESVLTKRQWLGVVGESGRKEERGRWSLSRDP